jgi:hypothetical protein
MMDDRKSHIIIMQLFLENYRITRHFLPLHSLTPYVDEVKMAERKRSKRSQYVGMSSLRHDLTRTQNTVERQINMSGTNGRMN